MSQVVELQSRTEKINGKTVTFQECTPFQSIGVRINNVAINGTVGMTLDQVIARTRSAGLTWSKSQASYVFADVQGGPSQEDLENLKGSGLIRERKAKVTLDLSEYL